MIALYIILGIVLFLAIILSLYVGVTLQYEKKSLSLILNIGPVKIRLFPKKKKKLKFKKTARMLRGKRISTFSPVSKKKKKQEKSYSKTVNSLLKTISDNSDDPSETGLGFDTAKRLIIHFKRGLKSRISYCFIDVDEGDAAKTCIRVSLISQGVAYISEFLNVTTEYTPPNKDKISINPVFDNSGYKFSFCILFRIRIFSVVRNLLSLVFKNILK